MRLLPTFLGATVAVAAVLGGGTVASATLPGSGLSRVEVSAPLAGESGTWGTAPWTLDAGVLTVGAGELGARGWDPFASEITRIVFTDPEATSAPGASQYLFSGLQNVTSIEGIERLDTSGVHTMFGMFASSPSLTSLDLSAWDTSGVTSMSNMFAAATSLSSLNTSGWDTSQVTDMSTMFLEAEALETVDVSNWDTSRVTSMYAMFFKASSLTSLDVSGWDTGRVTNLSAMFSQASGITELDVTGWDTSNVTTLYTTFAGTTALAVLDPSGWDTGNVTNTAHTFRGASLLTSLDLSGWDMSQVTDTQAMFQATSSLETLNTSGWDTRSVTNMEAMFHSATALTALDVTSWNTALVTNFRSTFYETRALRELDPSGFDTSSAWTMEGMFGHAESLRALDLSGWNTGTVTDMSAMFSDTPELRRASTAGWNTSQVTAMDYLFTNSGLPEVEVAGWDVSRVTTLFAAFGNMQRLTAIDLSGWNTENVADMALLFSGTPLRAITISDETSIPENVDLWIPSALIEPLANGRWVEVGSGTVQLPIRTKWDGSNAEFYEFTRGRLDAGTYVWQEKITVTYESNRAGATGETDTVLGATGRPVTVSENGFAVAGFRFVGWNTEADGSGTTYEAGQIENLAAGDYTLYAQWERVGGPTDPVGPEKPGPSVTPGTDPISRTGAGSAWGIGAMSVALVGLGAFLALRRRTAR